MWKITSIQISTFYLQMFTILSFHKKILGNLEGSLFLIDVEENFHSISTFYLQMFTNVSVYEILVNVN